jgi:DNA polymerase-3 subunit epsilon
LISLFKKRVYEPSWEFLNLHITGGNYVVIDTELTGLNYKKDSIVSIGAVKMTGSRIELGDTFYRVVKPQTVFTPESVVIHGITPSEAEKCLSIENILSEFLSFCKDSIIVGHFLFIDIIFLNKEIKRLYDSNIENHLVDTLRIYKWIKEYGDAGKHFFRGNEDDNLFSIAKKYQIQVSEAHNALIDAFITAQLFQRFLRYLHELGVKTIKDLLRIGRP